MSGKSSCTSGDPSFSKRLCCLSLLVEVILDLCGQSLALLRQERNVFLECVDLFEL